MIFSFLPRDKNDKKEKEILLSKPTAVKKAFPGPAPIPIAVLAFAAS